MWASRYGRLSSGFSASSSSLIPHQCDAGVARPQTCPACCAGCPQISTLNHPDIVGDMRDVHQVSCAVPEPSTFGAMLLSTSRGNQPYQCPPSTRPQCTKPAGWPNGLGGMVFRHRIDITAHHSGKAGEVGCRYPAGSIGKASGEVLFWGVFGFALPALGQGGRPLPGQLETA